MYRERNIQLIIPGVFYSDEQIASGVPPGNCPKQNENCTGYPIKTIERVINGYFHHRENLRVSIVYFGKINQTVYTKKDL